MDIVDLFTWLYQEKNISPVRLIFVGYLLLQALMFALNIGGIIFWVQYFFDQPTC